MSYIVTKKIFRNTLNTEPQSLRVTNNGKRRKIEYNQYLAFEQCFMVLQYVLL